MTTVLIIDDDPALLRALRLGLGRAGYDVLIARNGSEGTTQTAIYSPDVIVLDLGLPDVDGVELCSRLRKWSEVPILVLSATETEARKVLALDAGANDYITKPFGMAELEARIRASLRHHRGSDDGRKEITAGALQIDFVHTEASIAGERLPLTAREFELLAYLARNLGKLCTHQMILEGVWGRAYNRETQYLHVYIHRLREKLSAWSRVSIETVPGIGYSLRAEDPA